MNCPDCSWSNLPDEFQFCPTCGKRFDGKASNDEKVTTNQTPRQKGIRQGIALMLLSLCLIPAYFLLTPLFPPNDILIESHVSDTPFEQISLAILWTLFSVGVVRLIYARFFQKGIEDNIMATTNAMGATHVGQLQSGERRPTSGFGLWRMDREGEEAIPVAAEHPKMKSREDL